jgi:tetratricopeptide (TPR) repeat protein
MEAKLYYTVGDYEIAYKLADESLKIREYNTMAFHIKTRSGLALEMKRFIEEADGFEVKILEIFKKGKASRQDKLRVKMMSDVILSKYHNLSHRFIEDEELQESAKERFEKFQKINSQVKEVI